MSRRTKYTVRLTSTQIIALSKAVQAACWSETPFKGFGRTRKQHAIRAEHILLRAIQ